MANKGDECLRPELRERSGFMREYTPRQGRITGSGVIQDADRAVRSVNTRFGTRYNEPRDIVLAGVDAHLGHYNDEMGFGSEELS
jgi:hypothetical protein